MSEEEEEYKYIIPLKEKPKIKPRVIEPISKQIIEEFQKSGLRYALIKKEKIEERYKNTGAASRAIGRVIKNMNLQGQMKVYSDKEKVYFEKK